MVTAGAERCEERVERPGRSDHLLVPGQPALLGVGGVRFGMELRYRGRACHRQTTLEASVDDRKV